LVIGPDVDAQLQPYHEYECTGIDDEYVVDVDVTDRMIEKFAKPQRVVRLADGRVISRWDNALYTAVARDEFNRRIGQKEFALPDGAVELEMPAEDARKHGVGYDTMAACVKEYFGGFERDGRFYHRTNPNKRWDWWVIGGRWTGKLLLKAKARGIVGRAGLMTDPAPVGYCDQALKGDIDFARMRDDAEVKARILWTHTRRLTGGAAWESWDDTRLRYPNIEDARREYHAQPAVELLKASKLREYAWQIDDDLALDMDIFMQRARDKACSFFAFVRDAQWTERGRAGWFGCISDEISDVQWHSMFNRMLDALPDDALLTVVDCHI
jgi:hypothetical protein